MKEFFEQAAITGIAVGVAIFLYGLFLVAMRRKVGYSELKRSDQEEQVA